MESLASAFSLESSVAATINGPTTVAALIGRDLTDERSLTLAKAPIYVLRQQAEDGSTAYTLVIQAALGRRALMDLLYTIAPYKAHGPDRFGRVLDNWGLFDRSRTSDASANLMQQHVASLRQHWRDFAMHRDLFVAVFEDQTEQTRVVPVLAWTRSPSGLRRLRASPAGVELLEALRNSMPSLRQAEFAEAQLDSLVGLVTIPYFQPELCRSWPSWRPLVRGGKSNYLGPASVPIMALMHRRALLNSTLVRQAEAGIGASATNC